MYNIVINMRIISIQLMSHNLLKASIPHTFCIPASISLCPFTVIKLHIEDKICSFYLTSQFDLSFVLLP